MQMFAILSFLINVTQKLFDEQRALAKRNDKFSPQLTCRVSAQYRTNKAGRGCGKLKIRSLEVSLIYHCHDKNFAVDSLQFALQRM